MLSRLKLHHGKKYQPLPRVGHTTVASGDRVYLWGGWHKLVPKVHSSSEKVKALSVVEVYNLRTGDWCQLPTSGIPPLGVAHHACANISDDIYYFGGRCGHSGCHHNTLHRLSTVTMKWKDVTPVASHSAADSGPMKKAQCGMVAYRWRNEDFLAVFGGYGLLPDRHQPQATYVPKRGKPEYGWTNEMHVFSIQSGAWSVPVVSGDPPPPCSNFTVVSVSETQAVLFGGYQADCQRMNDVYIAEFGKESVFWTKISPPADGSSIPWPSGTCDHSMTFAAGLYGSQPCPCILIVGGENDESKVLSDCWIFELSSTKWTHVALPVAVAGRLYHCISSFTLGPHCVWVVLFGGVAEMEEFKDWQEQPMMADTAIIELMKRDNEEWIATVIFDNSAPTSLDDYLRKLSDRVFQGRKDWITVTTKIVSVLPPDKEQDRVVRAEKRADDAEQEAAEARKVAEAAQQLVTKAKENVVKERKESISLFGDLSDARKRAQLVELQIKATQDDYQKAKVEAKEYKEQLSEAKKKLEEVQEMARQDLIRVKNELSSLQSVSMSSMSSSGPSSCSIDLDQWLIDPDDVLINKDELLMRSRTGDFYTGYFHGTKVSVKTLCKTQQLDEFKKFVSINTKLHHPNLLLFMGATIGDNPIVVSEYAAFKPLNIHLEEAPLTRAHILSLAKDVCCALNYLHLHHPAPVTHGSLSSQTVLLEPNGSGWKGKLTDTGFFPFLVQPLSTYAAPEVIDTNAHSPQLDVYSFGVLLIEMYCRKALGSSSSEREKQLQHINWPHIVLIIRACLKEAPHERPLISNVLLDLEQ